MFQVSDHYQGYITHTPIAETLHSPLPGVELKYQWSYTSIPPISRHGVDRNNFTFSMYIYRKPSYF